jgi:hypothetical protein
LVEGTRRTRAVKRRSLQESRLWGPGHRRLDRNREFLRADAQGRRDRTRDARRGCGCGVARTGRRNHRREGRVAPRFGTRGAFRRVRGSGRAACGAGRRTAQGSFGVPPDWSRGRRSPAGQRKQGERACAIHNRHPRARNAHGPGRAPAAFRRQGCVIRCDRHAFSRWRRRREADPHGCGRLRTRFLARLQGTRSPSGDVGRVGRGTAEQRADRRRIPHASSRRNSCSRTLRMPPWSRSTATFNGMASVRWRGSVRARRQEPAPRNDDAESSVAINRSPAPP